MRLWLLGVLSVIFLTGCTIEQSGPKWEPDLLNSIPVVSLVTRTGVSTAWLDENSVLISTSHGIPRGEASGQMCVSSVPVTYQVIDSGDGLKREWSVWDAATIAGSGQCQDWAKLSVFPAIDPSSIFPKPQKLTIGTQPPKVGEQLLLIGYTFEGGKLARYWTPITIIDVPAVHRELDAGHHVWFKTSTHKRLRPGFSGAPLLRQTGDGLFEVCAMMVSAQHKKGGSPLDVGVAIIVP